MVIYHQGYPLAQTASGGPVQYNSAPVGTMDDLWKLADQILSKVVETYAQADVPLPDRQYIVVATPVHDCEQVTVSWQQSYIGPPGDEASTPQRCDGPRSAVFQVAVVRCIPVADDRNRAPAPADISNAARVLMRDAWLLLSSVSGWDDYLGVIATVEGGEAQGGLQAVILTLTLGVP